MVKGEALLGVKGVPNGSESGKRVQMELGKSKLNSESAEGSQKIILSIPDLFFGDKHPDTRGHLHRLKTRLKRGELLRLGGKVCLLLGREKAETQERST